MRYTSIIIYLCLAISSSIIHAQQVWTTYRENIVDDITAITLEGDSIWLGTYNGMAKYNKITGESVPFTKEDGLINNEINDIAVGHDGVKWIATNGGISRFDGVSFTSYEQKDIGYSEIIEAAVDNNNVKWFISQNAVIKYDDVTWHTYTIDNGLPAESLTTIEIDKTNSVWIGTNKKGIISFDGDKWYLHEEYRKNIVAIVIAEDNTKWFGDYQGSVISLDGINWNQLQVISSMWYLYDVTVSSDNSLWACTNFGLYNIKNSEKKLFNKDNGLIESYCRSIICDSNGDLWIAGYLGLSMFDGIQFKNFLGFSGLLNKSVYSIAIDHKNVKWFGHNTSSVSGFNDLSWSGFILKEYENIGENIEVDNNNVKWFSAGWDGAVSYNNTKTELLEIKGQSVYGNFYSLYTRSLTIDSNNTIYFATSLETYDDLFLHEIPALSYKYENAELVFYGEGIVSIDSDSHDNLWALKPYGYFYSRSFGIYCYDGVHWIPKIVAGETDIVLNKIYVDRNDCIWAFSATINEYDIRYGLTGTGLLFYDNNEWTVFTDKNSGLASSNTFSVVVDHNNIAWIGTDSGVTRFDGETWTTFNTQNSGLCCNKVNAIAVDNNNVLWFGTDKGVSRYTGEIITTSVDEETQTPETLPLIKTYPNPFNPSTTIEFTLPESGLATVTIYSMAGQKIRELIADFMSAGTHTLSWDGKDTNGNLVSSGIYITRLQAGKHAATGRMVLVR